MTFFASFNLFFDISLKVSSRYFLVVFSILVGDKEVAVLIKFLPTEFIVVVLQLAQRYFEGLFIVCFSLKRLSRFIGRGCSAACTDCPLLLIVLFIVSRFDRFCLFKSSEIFIFRRIDQLSTIKVEITPNIVILTSIKI